MKIVKEEIEKKTPQQRNIEWHTQAEEKAVYEQYKDLHILTYHREVRGEIKPCLKIWKGRQANPFVNYYYGTDERRNEALRTAKEGADYRIKEKAKIKLERAAFTPEFEVGDIYYTSWGYEQTNVEFYQVIEKPSPHYAIIKEIAQDYQPTGDMQGRVKPIKGKFLDKPSERRKITKHGINFSSYRSAWKWDKEDIYTSSYY
jgi:5-hydroxyisourate hydrolase-like protein (transthyretin family)